MKTTKSTAITVHGTTVAVLPGTDGDYLSITDMLEAKDGDFFIADWLRNHNTMEFLGIRESVVNPDFNHGEFATIENQVGLNSYKLSVKEWAANTHAVKTHLVPSEVTPAQVVSNDASEAVKRLNQIAIRQMQTLIARAAAQLLDSPNAGGRP